MLDIRSTAPNTGWVPQTLLDCVNQLKVEAGARSRGFAWPTRSRIWPARSLNMRRSTAAEVMYELVDVHRDSFGEEPICEVLQIAPTAFGWHAAQCRNQ